MTRAMTRAEKEAKVRAVEDNEWLLECLIRWAKDFNPLDDDKCESYEVIKAEVLRRMEA